MISPNDTSTQKRQRVKSRRVLRDLTSIAEYERVYTSRQRTLMQKAFELEEATGAEVIIVVFCVPFHGGDK